jgi:hypothetical protein
MLHTSCFHFLVNNLFVVYVRGLLTDRQREHMVPAAQARVGEKVKSMNPIGECARISSRVA